jgi:hypothetical protein
MIELTPQRIRYLQFIVGAAFVLFLCFIGWQFALIS